MIEAKNARLSGDCLQPHGSLSFCVAEGQVLCVTGPSGSGKTRLVETILGFWPLESGYITVEGEPVVVGSAVYFRERMFYVPQDVTFNSGKVDGLITQVFGLKVHHGKALDKEQLMQLWQMLGLDEGLYRAMLREVPAPQLQKIMLSMAALLRQSMILIDGMPMDEPAKQYITHLKHMGSIVILTAREEQQAAWCDKMVRL